MTGGRGSGGGAGSVPGRLIAVVGPSGVGKDSVIEGLVARVAGLVRARRNDHAPPGGGGRCRRRRLRGHDAGGNSPAARGGGMPLPCAGRRRARPTASPKRNSHPRRRAGRDRQSFATGAFRRPVPPFAPSFCVLASVGRDPRRSRPGLDARGRERTRARSSRAGSRRDTGPLSGRTKGLTQWLYAPANDGKLRTTPCAAAGRALGNRPPCEPDLPGKPPEQLRDDPRDDSFRTRASCCPASATGSVVIRDGVIAAVDTGLPCRPAREDCEAHGWHPGLWSLHTDNLERHMEPCRGVDWPHPAASFAHDAKLGRPAAITTVFDAMRVGSITARPHGLTAPTRGRLHNGDCWRCASAGALPESAIFLHLRARKFCIGDARSRNLRSSAPTGPCGHREPDDHTATAPPVNRYLPSLQAPYASSRQGYPTTSS